MKFDHVKIVFLQKDEVIKQQKTLILSFFKKSIPNAKISFYGSAEQVPVGEQADILITPTLEWLDAALERLRGIQWIHFLSAGIEKIWKMQFDKQSLLMSKSSGVHVNTMSEYALAAILYFEKQFNKFVTQSGRREWSRSWLGELSGKKLIILGVGAIGQKLAERASNFGMTVVGSVNTPREIAYLDKTVRLNEIGLEMCDADYLVVCLPLTDSTKGVVDTVLLSNLKPGAVLVDISRGGVVREDAVLAALETGVLRGAALDVFEQQPLPAESALWARDDVLITPHVSGTTQNYMPRALEVFLKNFESLKATGVLSTPVDVKLGY
ncbi:MAG: D-2-hydroxyacid dehydrogenase [Pseudomonas sp.]|nr:D-2-hydroxyacid dehydrogenase [Pseudomonas sp.]